MCLWGGSILVPRSDGPWVTSWTCSDIHAMKRSELNAERLQPLGTHKGFGGSVWDSYTPTRCQQMLPSKAWKHFFIRSPFAWVLLKTFYPSYQFGALEFCTRSIISAQTRYQLMLALETSALFIRGALVFTSSSHGVDMNFPLFMEQNKNWLHTHCPICGVISTRIKRTGHWI